MTSTFTGFSEEDLKRIKSSEVEPSNGLSSQINSSTVKKVDKLGGKPKRPTNSYKLPILQLQNQSSDEAIDTINFEKCKLSIKTPTSSGHDTLGNIDSDGNDTETETNTNEADVEEDVPNLNLNNNEIERPSNEVAEMDSSTDLRKCSTTSTPDIVRGVSNYSEEELAAHKVKLGELQLKQKLMEEQNKKRKEMLAKALADRTKQTEEEVMKLEKIKKELQVLDGQFSLDVAVLRKKIDQACLSYADAEKHYLKVEKEFLQAKINLQKEREKKELLTEHLCALITHNETRKAQKLETLMLELATDKKREIEVVNKSLDDEEPIIIDGVDQRTGKMVELPIES
ncbi:RAB6-interacting golgin [Ostrinia furnacalis]|uniref:RAB6-interacting golgin n=1 Tax=Ostrinia furnacalis TaxID=93504 RepID=UPI00104028EA|nr:RAB6-interacting golgin [Ostrinia furnacalis]